MRQTKTPEMLRQERWVTTYRQRHPVANRWAEGYGVLPHSREQEQEADRIGVELAARAGYDPRAAVSLWQKMAARGGQPPQWLSTHPAHETRIRDLQDYAQRVLPLYRAEK